MPWRTLVLVLLLALGAARTPAADLHPLAEPRFESVGPGDAIPQSVVSALAQDRAGFLWIGTGAGLLRHDGHQFRPQLRGAGQGLGFVRALLLASDGRLWIGTESDGVAVLDTETEELREYRSSPAVPDGLPPGTVRALAEDRDGALWIGTVGHGLSRLDPASGRFSHFRAGQGDFGLDDDRIQSLLVDSRGSLWVGSWRGLSRRPAGGTRLEPVAPELAGRIVARLFEAADGRIWAGTQQGELLLVSADGGTSQRLDEEGPTAGARGGSVYAFAEARPGRVWVGRAQGIELRTADGRLLRHVRHHPFNPAGLAANEVRVLLRDRAGWIWVGSYGGGLQHHNPDNTAIWVLRQERSQGAIDEEINARSLLQLDSGEVWVGTNAEGVLVLDAELRRRATLRPAAIGDGRVAALAQAADGSIWLGNDAGLHRLDRHGRVLERLQPGEGRVRRLLAGRDGALWIGTQDGLFRHRAGRLERLAASDGTPVTGDVNALAEDAGGALWVGTEKGLLHLPAGAARLQPVAMRAGAGLSHASVVGLLVDSRQRLWVDTALGLHRLLSWDQREAAFERVSERLGQAGRAFGANLLEDGRGRIWSQQFLYDPAKDSLYRFSPADGVDIGTGWFRAYTALADGRLLFGGSKGVLVVAPAGFERWSYEPPLVVSELRIEGQREPLARLREGLRLTPEQRRFGMEFAALDFSAPQASQYAYRLQGFDADWLQAGTQARSLAYGPLPPGRYRLQVRATNRSGAWSPHELSIPIEVLPAWWQTWWARVLAGLLALAVLAGVVQLRTHMLRQRQLVLERRVGERTRELEALSEALRQKSVALEEASLSDPLTGLRNRRFLSLHIDADVALCLRRHEQAGGAGAAGEEDDLLFFLLDLDHFKAVNDEHGHAAGDALLTQIQARLRAVFRESDYLVRWGGEEFLIVARATSRRHAAELAERARAMVAGQPFLLDKGQPLVCSCSVGFACFPLSRAAPRALDWSATVALADAALYAAKHAGRDTWAGVLAAPAGLDAATLAARARRPAEWLESGELATVRPG
jgi:diguanylate cyclase (GGDEF)-like protein